MRFRRTWAKPRHLLAAAALASVVVGQGCAAERDPINQVQVGVLPKSFFLGAKLEDASDDPEFYFRTTVVDVSAGAGSESLFTSSDAQPTVRIRWEVTETKLIGRLAYELVAGTDAKGTSGAPRDDEPRAGKDKKAPARRTNDGQIVASFAIQKHFDIRRRYNSETGEESNVIVENDLDRPWHQREYIRVDWSANLVTDAYDLDAASQLGLWGGVKWDPIAYHVSDPDSADAPALDLTGGYLDVTNKAYAAPQMVHDEEFGDFPACMLAGAFPRISCNPSEVKMRLAFRRISPTDYEPLDFDGSRMEMFGYFTNDRYGYDRRYGVVDEKWHRFVSRWNLFEKSHVDAIVACATPETTPAGASPHRDDDKDGTEDECAAVGRGSRCDEFNQACTIPLRDRKVRTIAWHVNREFPDDLFESSRKVIKTWSDAVRVAVVSGRLAECRRTKDGGCEQAMGWPSRWSDDFVPPLGSASTAEVPEVFVLCHNPVDPAKGDDPACGKEGTSPRLGDLRYNLYTYVTSPQASAPWGIMMDAEDPLSGEKISGSVNMYGGTLDKAAGQLVDLVDLLNGVTPTDQFIRGKDVSDWVQANRPGGAESRPAPMSATELTGRLGAFDPKAMAPFATGASKGPRKGPASLRHKQRMKELADAGKLGAGNGAITERLQRLRGGDIEAKLITPEVAQMSGVDPSTALTKATIERASPFTRTAPMMRHALERRASLGRARRHSCRREAPETDHLIGLAKTAQVLFGKVDPKDPIAVQEHKAKVYGWAREKYSASVYSHEFGHSVGLRHNFAGTFDSLNYDDKYWQLRTKDGSVTKACAAGTTDGSDCIGPRYSDPITQEEIDKGIGGFATSSVMDYPGDQQLDMFVIGKYDRAAVRFGYGGVVDVWAAPGVSVDGSGEGRTKAYELTAMTSSPGLFGVAAFPQPDSDEYKHLHYSRYQSEFGLISDCKSDPESPIGTSCRGAPMDVVDYRDLRDFVPIPEYAAFLTTRQALDDKGRVRRGYMFSSDEYADSGNVPSFSYDAGADPYEQVRFLESAYENRYLLDAFRRNRTQFNSWDVVLRTQSHYLDPIPAHREDLCVRDGPRGRRSDEAAARAPRRRTVRSARDRHERRVRSLHADAHEAGAGRVLLDRERRLPGDPAAGPLRLHLHVGPVSAPRDDGVRLLDRPRQRPLHPQRLRLRQGLLVVRLPEAGRLVLRQDLGGLLPLRGVRLVHLELEGRLRRRALQERQLRHRLSGADAPPLRRADDRRRRVVRAARRRARRGHPEREPRLPAVAPRGRRRHTAGVAQDRRPGLRLERAALRDGVGHDVLPDELVERVHRRRAHHRARERAALLARGGDDHVRRSGHQHHLPGAHDGHREDLRRRQAEGRSARGCSTGRTTSSSRRTSARPMRRATTSSTLTGRRSSSLRAARSRRTRTSPAASPRSAATSRTSTSCASSSRRSCARSTRRSRTPDGAGPS